MAWTPFRLQLALAVTLCAIIGAERQWRQRMAGQWRQRMAGQWRQRMAGQRSNALAATGAAIFILSSIITSPDSPGCIAAQVVSGIGFPSAGGGLRARG